MPEKGSIFRIRTTVAVLIVVVSFCSSVLPQTVPAADRVAILLKDLENEKPEVRRDAARALGTMGMDAKDAVPALVRVLSDANSEVRNSASDALGKLGPTAEPAVPALIDKLAGGFSPEDLISRILTRRLDTAPALVKLGPVAVPRLVQALRDKSDERRLQVVSILREIGPPAAEAAPDLVLALRDESELVRAEASRALARLWVASAFPYSANTFRMPVQPKPPPMVVSALIDALRDTTVSVRREAALTLRAFGPLSGPAVPALTRALQDPSDSVRESVCSALGAIGTAAKPAVPALIESLTDKNGRVRELASEALRVIGTAPGGSVPELIVATRDKDSRVRLTAVDLLAGTRPVTAEITAALIQCLNDVNDEVRAKAFEGLTPWEGTVSALVYLLKSGDQTARWRAIHTLARFGPAAKDAVPALIETLAGGESLSHVDALDALAAIGPDAVPALIRAARTGNDDARYLTLSALARSGPAGTEAVLETVRRGSAAERVDAAKALQVIGQEKQESLWALITALKDKSEQVRKTAAVALGLSKEANPEVSSALFDALQDDAEAVRRGAAFALGANDPNLIWVVERLGDADETLRRRAANALGLLGAEFATYSYLPSAEGRRQMVDQRAVPALVRTLADRSESVRGSAAMALRQFRNAGQTKPALVGALADPAESVRFAAALSLVHIGSGEPVLSLLTASLSDKREDRRLSAAAALGEIGSTAALATPALMMALSDSSPQVRRAAAFSLGAVGSRAPEMVPVLLTALHDSDATLRESALDQLARFEPVPQAAILSVIAALPDVSSWSRERAIKALARVPSDASALKAVIAALRDESTSVRIGAADALAGMTTIPAPAVPELIHASEDEESAFRAAAIRALEHAQPQTPEVQSSLIASIWQSGQSVYVFDKPSIAAHLESSAVPALINSVERRKGDERAKGVAVFEEMGESARPAAPYLISLLTDPNELVRTNAAGALGKVSAPPERAVPALIEALRDPAPEVQRAAAQALGGFGPAARDAVPALVPLIGSRSERVARGAADGLAGIGAEAVPALVALFKPQTKPGSPYSSERAPAESYAAEEILVRIGASDSGAAPLFITPLKDGADRLRAAAATALGKTSADWQEAIPALQYALQDKTSEVRRAAVLALGSRGAPAKQALASIIGLLQESDPWLRSSALTALRTIAEGLQDAQDVTENERLTAAVALLAAADSQADPRALRILGDAWSVDQRQLRRTVEALQAIEKQVVISRGSSTDAALGPPIEGMDDLKDLSSAVEVGGKSLPANTLFFRGSDNKVRINPNGGVSIGQAEGFFTAFIRATGQKITLIKEQGKLRVFRPYRNSYAILIAISAYAPDSGYAPLPRAVPQARELEEVLRKQGFDVIYTLYDRDATAERIRAALSDPRVTDEDRLFVYFGGHGDDVQRLQRIGFIVPYGANKKDLTMKGIPLEDLRTAANISMAKQILFALDSCQSGLVITRDSAKADEDKLRALRDIEAMSRTPGRMFLTAGTGGQPALDVNGGIFTRALIQAIAGQGDGGSRGVVTFHMLYAYIQSMVNNWATGYGQRQDPAAELTPVNSGWVFVMDRSLLR